MRVRTGFDAGRNQARQRVRRMSRRIGELVRTLDDRDVGIRPGVSIALGLEGDREVIVNDVFIAPTRWLRVLSHRWLTRGQA